ncbi:hypothetical protein N9Z53_00615 [Mariniblastus sp.]|nr:hypothetical protein [Mariniblastus sp.]
MNQNKRITGIRQARFYPRIELPSFCFLVFAIAGLQGCDTTENVGVEKPANADGAVAESAATPSELDRPIAVKNSENSLAILPDGDSSGQKQEESKQEESKQEEGKQEEGKQEGLSNPSSPERDAAEDGSVFSQAGKMVGDAATKSVKSASDAGQWVQETLGDATKSGAQSAADTWDWANETFESLKSQGLTSAQSTSQWLGQDWKNMESWQYQIVVLDGEPAEVAKKLNELGEQGWECFEVTDLTSTSTKFYMKKPTFSYLRQLPFKDVIKLVPLMNTGEK